MVRLGAPIREAPMSEHQNILSSGILGLRHLALKVRDVETSKSFYESLFQMKVVWQPDPDNVYMSSGVDNLALHQIPKEELEHYPMNAGQFLDHFGFIMDSPDSVNRLYELAVAHNVPIVHHLKQHRDGSYSFYLSDPDRLTIQILYEPTVSPITFQA